MSVTVEVARLESDELREGLNRLLPQLSVTANPMTSRDLDTLLSSPATTLFVAYNDGAIVGMLTLVIFQIPTGLRAWIEDVVVDEHARGVGAGAALTQAAIDESRRRGIRSIDLTSRPSRTAANALYQRMGFEARETNIYRLDLN